MQREFYQEIKNEKRKNLQNKIVFCKDKGNFLETKNDFHKEINLNLLVYVDENLEEIRKKFKDSSGKKLKEERKIKKVVR